MDTNKIVRVEVYPAIGISRVGNSPDEFYLGPEAPGHPPRPMGGFKDKQGRIKRQGQRFRLFGYDENGKVIGELTAKDGAIDWTVHLVNGKACWEKFVGRFGKNKGLRNDHIKNTKEDPNARDALVIDPGPRTVSGRNIAGKQHQFDSGKFLGLEVPLGEVRTDEAGRLIVLGGFGHSATEEPDNPITWYANNPLWHDDTSDGPVSAKVTLNDGRELESNVARVLVVPPNYAPEVDTITTLYDVIRDASIEGGYLPKPADKPAFTRDIYPILKRLVDYQWVNGRSFRGHGPGRGGDFMNSVMLPKLASKSKKNQPLRASVFERIRDVDIPYDDPKADEQANYAWMPAMAGDGGEPEQGKATTWLRLRPSQYRALKQWAAGRFEEDGLQPLEHPSFEETPVSEQPDCLTRGALEPCVGAPFFPGIEMTYISEDPKLYSSAFRISPDVEPGGITKFMAIPWQADFYECRMHWWPAQRPDDVVPESLYEQMINDPSWPAGAPGAAPPDAGPGPSLGKASDSDIMEQAAERLGVRKAWDRGVADYYHELSYDKDRFSRDDEAPGDNGLVDLWSEMGFVVSKPAPNGEQVLVETEREPFAGIDHRDFYYRLSNIDSNLDFIPKAKWLAQRYLQQGWDSQKALNFPDSWRYFDYTPEAFEARLNEIYNDLVDSAAAYDPANDQNFKTRESAIEWLFQMAPFNQNDGAWLSRATPAGPLSEVQSLMFSIWMDEAGDGKPQWSHCNLYTDLLHNLGYYLPDVHSRDYATDSRFLDSAFTVPSLELAVGMFPTSFYPELLGFTLELEWTVVSLKPMIALLDYFDIDSHFFALHVGIDNAAAGHGARAKRAIMLYLDEIRQQGGEQAVQETWRRIWTGFITFGNTGVLGHELQNRINKPLTPAQQVQQIIVEKRPYGSLNHGEIMLGANRINDWFADPKGFMKALVEAEYIVPGDPNNSPFFQFTSFKGPMFKVFTDDEMQIWRNWCLSLGKADAPIPIDSGVEMANLVNAMRLRQMGIPEHAEVKLTGEDPNVSGKIVERSVSWWFQQITGPGHPATLALMTALADPANKWIVPGNPDKSPFITQLLAASNAMGKSFDTIAPNTGGLSHREVALQWIKDGCPVPRAAGPQSRRYRLLDPPSEESVYPPARIHGMGSIH